jgi:hypothetical protein
MIDIDIARLHLRVDGNEEDAIIQVYLNAAIEYAKQYLNRNIVADESEKQGSDIVMNDSIKGAILLLLGHWYAHREEEALGTISTRLKMGTEALLFPYRIEMGV